MRTIQLFVTLYPSSTPKDESLVQVFKHYSVRDCLIAICCNLFFCEEQDLQSLQEEKLLQLIDEYNNEGEHTIISITGNELIYKLY